MDAGVAGVAVSEFMGAWPFLVLVQYAYKRPRKNRREKWRESAGAFVSEFVGV